MAKHRPEIYSGYRVLVPTRTTINNRWTKSLKVVAIFLQETEAVEYADTKICPAVVRKGSKEVYRNVL